MYTEIECTSWLDLKAHLVPLHTCRFRGQSDSTWDLKTTLQREHEAQNINYQPGRGHYTPQLSSEAQIIRTFRRYAHQYLQNTPDEDDNLAWLSIIQHHGGPTRLLDFTKSLYIAAFFAVESATKDSAIWMIDGTLLLRSFQKSVEDDNEASVLLESRIESILFDDGIYRPQKALFISPTRLHERSWIQKGDFLIPTLPDKGIHSCLAKTYGHEYAHFDKPDKNSYSLLDLANARQETLNCNTFEDTLKVSEPYHLVKIIIPRRIHGEIIHDLESMNLTSATLFPGIDGFARSLKHSIFPPQQWQHQ